jgi:hypothetical protein
MTSRPKRCFSPVVFTASRRCVSADAKDKNCESKKLAPGKTKEGVKVH